MGFFQKLEYLEIRLIIKMAIIIFIIILSILVLIHEFGHFFMAKRNGIGVEEFGIGLPPRIWGKKIGETIYSVNWLPFGGFVRLIGEDPTDDRRDQKNSFYTKSIWQRSQVVVAGVVMNLLLAVIVFYVVLAALGFKFHLPNFFPHEFKFAKQTTTVQVVDVGQDSPAAAAGIEIGESIIEIDGQPVGSVETLQTIIQAAEDKDIGIVLESPVDNSIRSVRARPQFSQELNAPALGIGLGELITLNYETPVQKLASGFTHSYNMVEYSGKVLGQLIGFSIRERDITPVSEGISGPIGIAAITSQAVSLGVLSTVQLAGILSLNFAILNILPIPALDGGRFAFIIFEAVTRKRPHAIFEKWVHTAGFALLIGLILLITYNDILKLIR